MVWVCARRGKDFTCRNSGGFSDFQAEHNFAPLNAGISRNVSGFVRRWGLTNATENLPRDSFSEMNSPNSSTDILPSMRAMMILPEDSRVPSKSGQPRRSMYNKLLGNEMKLSEMRLKASCSHSEGRAQSRRKSWKKTQENSW